MMICTDKHIRNLKNKQNNDPVRVNNAITAVASISAELLPYLKMSSILHLSKVN